MADKDLAGLPKNVRAAFTLLLGPDAIVSVGSYGEKSKVRRILKYCVRLASENAELIEQTYRLGDELAKDKLRAARAEAELAKLRVALDEAKDSETFAWSKHDHEFDSHREARAELAVLKQQNAELLDVCQHLANEVSELRDANSIIGSASNFDFGRAERAETELAALKQKIAAAPKQVYGRDDWHEPLVGKRVALVRVDHE